MKRIVSLTALALVLAALPLLGQSPRRAANQEFASDFQTVPVMANNAGVGGAPFISYLALLNPTARAFSVVATLYDTTGTPRTATVNLAAGELRTFTNFLADTFNFTGGGTVTFSSADPANRFIVSTEITSNRYATPIPALEFAGSNSRSYAPGIWVDSTSRTNIGCFNQSSSQNRIVATVRDRTGAQTLGTVEMDLPARAWGQRAVTATVIGGYVQFDPSEAAVCYAVIVDNATNDGRFLAATEYKP